MDAIAGKFNRLTVNRKVDFGVFLDGGEAGEILMPAKYVPEGTEPGAEVDVFVYYDTMDRIIATTEKPLLVTGECAALICKSITKYGAFLDWGLTKDLFVPFREQKTEMKEGRPYVVTAYPDKLTKRIVGSTKIEKYLNKSEPTFEPGQEVSLLIFSETPLGYKAVINHTHTGILYHNEVFQPLAIGQTVKGYIKLVRPDGKTDLSLQQTGGVHQDEMAEKLLKMLEKAGGFIPATDKTGPDDIYDQFGMSKKAWKKAVGSLYKARLISLEEDGIRLRKR
ncbi:MAG: GntR family transcriptional regulator [Bacteroidetes bacterium]|nr:GntR family transcriptional regulator [Bacteroidota bacterium]